MHTVFNMNQDPTVMQLILISLIPYSALILLIFSFTIIYEIKKTIKICKIKLKQWL